MASVNWKAATSGTWSTGANWSTGVAPGANDVVSIATAGTYTVTISAAAAAKSLSMSDASATLIANASLALSAGLSDEQSLMDIAAGTLSVSGGMVTLGTSAAIGNIYSGATIDGPGTLSTAAGVTTNVVAGPNYYGAPFTQLLLGGAVTWSNSGIVSDSGIIQIGDTTGESATIVNNAGGVFQFLSPYSAIVDSNGASGTFSNAGTLVETTTTNVAVVLNNTSTGVIDLRSGTLNLQAGGTIAGTITGGGALAFSSGAGTLTAVTDSGILVAGGSVVLGETASVAGSVSETSGSIYVAETGPASVTLAGGFSDTQGQLSIAAGKTLDLTGAATLGTSVQINNNYAGATIDGPGTLVTAAGATTAIVGGPNYYGTPFTQLVLGGAVTWSNSGTVSDSGIIQIGNNAGETARIVNAAGGVFQFLTPYSAIIDSNGASGSFSNAGTIIETTNTNFAANLTNTGVIDLQAGVLNFQAGDSIGGTVTGGGTLEFSGGASTLTALTQAGMLVAGGTVTLAETDAITGSISETTGGVYVSAAGPASVTAAGGFSDTQGQLSIAAGKTLDLTGAVTLGTSVQINSNYSGATINGPGTLATVAGDMVTIVGGPNYYGTPFTQLLLGGNVTWSNTGTVADAGIIQIGDSSGETAKIVNNAGGVFQFLSPYSSIVDSNGASGSFSNAGTIVATTNSNMAVALTNSATGLIDLQAGTLDLQAGSTIGGTVTGIGTLDFSAGSSTLTAATSGNILVGGGVLTLATTGPVSGMLTDDGGTIQVSKNVSLSGVLVDQAGLISILGGNLTSKAITIDSGATLSGFGAASGSVINNGIVLAENGKLAVGAHSLGGGIFEIAGGAALQFNGAVSGSQLSFLTGGAETLLLATPKTVQATLSGFGATDTIDLLKTAATGLSYANNTLTVTGASGTLATLGFAGTYAQANFGLQADGAGGVDIIFSGSGAVSPHAVLPDFTASSAPHLPAGSAIAHDTTGISAAAYAHLMDALPAFDLLHHGLLL